MYHGQSVWSFEFPRSLPQSSVVVTSLTKLAAFARYEKCSIARNIMSSRKNIRSQSQSRLTVKKSNKVTAIVRIKIEDKTLFRCVICGNAYPRRFNAERHYKRFHEITQERRCCDETFYTKSDYYDHKENVHDERKRYGRRWKEGTQSSDSSIECNIVAINEPGDCALDVISHAQNNTKIQTSFPIEITKERTFKKCADTNSAHHAQDNAENLESNNKEKSNNNMRQSIESQKICIYRLKLESSTSQNSAPLRSIENFTENSLNKPLRKNTLQNVVKVSSSADKENVIIYDYTTTSISGLMQLLKNTIDF